MRPVSDAFLRAVRGSHAMSARARVCAPGQTGTDPTGTVIPIFGGSVELDATADVRSTLDMTTDGTDAWPSRDNLLLAPYGNELFIERGVQFGGGTTEWCSLGYFRIENIGQDNPPDGPIKVQASDRMVLIVEADLTSPRQYTASQTFGAVVDDLVLDVAPWATIEWDDATDVRTIGRDLLVEQKRFEALRDLITSAGKVMWWDHRGVLVIKSPPDPTQPVYEVTHGRDGVLVSMARELTRDGVHNGWVVTGEGADTDSPIRAVVVDSNPRSPTFWHGSFGQVPGFHSSPAVTDPASAQQTAAALLSTSLGLPYSVDFGTIPNPALEPYDPIRVSYSDKHGRELHIVDSLSVPLTADGVMTGATREQTLVIGGLL